MPRPQLGFAEAVVVESSVVAPDAKGKDAAAADQSGAAACLCEGFDWKNVPPVHPFPRPGYFNILPKGPGYYSLADQLHHEFRAERPKYGYMPFALQPPSFFDTDFRYLDDPKTPAQDFLEQLHRVHLGDNWLFATGGEFRWRHMHETNARLSGKTNDYDLLRTRVFMDLWYQDRFRAFVEYLDADTLNENLPPNITDVDRSDLLNAFIEMKVWDDGCSKAYVRGGRQELLFGSQRLISPPEWLNTRRTFNGVRAYYQSPKWDVDLFWRNRSFPTLPISTPWTTIRTSRGSGRRTDPRKTRPATSTTCSSTTPTTSPSKGSSCAPYNVHTLGTRWVGDKDHWLYDVELMAQLGDRGEHHILAGAASAGVGYHFACLPMNPVAWLNYDYASGDQNPNVSDFHTFNQLFAFGHYYLGWLDLVGRQNIHDVSAHLHLNPTKWISANFQFHHFELACAKDALYNAAGNAIRRDPTGNAGRSVGNEIDVIVNFHLSRRTDVLVGYSRLFAGNFIEDTGPGADPELFYVMYNYRW